MINLSLTCTLTFIILGMAGMLGYLLSAYQRLRDKHEVAIIELKKYQEQIS
jgi:CTP:phosphocholine cytidylyltransferase-like protein